MGKFFNYLLYTFAFCVIYLPSIAQTKSPLNLSSKAYELRIYPEKALVKRKAEVYLKSAGRHSIQFRGLSAFIDANTVQLKGNGKFSVLSVKFKTDFLISTTENIKLQALKDSASILERMQAHLENEKQSLIEEQALLLSNKIVGGSQSGLNIEVLKQTAAYYKLHLPQIKDRIFELSVALKNLKLISDRLLAQLGDYQQKQQLPSGMIEAEIYADAPATLQFDFSYICNQAWWETHYSLRAHSDSKLMDLVLSANVRQASNENWDNVHLILSSAQPALGNSLPELSPWYLDIASTPVPMPLSKSNEKLRMDVMSMEEAQTQSQYASMAQQSDRLVAVEFDLPGTWSIASDNEAQQIEIQQYKLNADFVYQTVPKYIPEVFLTGKIYNYQDFDLLDGPMDVFLDETFSASTYLNPGLNQDTLTISLGKSNNITVKRNLLKEYSTSKFYNNKKYKTYSYEIKIKSNLKQSAKLLIVDQIPVSQNKEIEIEDIKAEGAQIDANTGEVKWNINLAPNSELIKKISFTIKYPPNTNISGL